MFHIAWQGHVMTYLDGALTDEVARAAQFIRRHNTVERGDSSYCAARDDAIS